MSSGWMLTSWDEEAGFYRCQDQIIGKLADAGISAAFLPLFAGVASKEQAAKLVENQEKWLCKVKYGVPSLNPEDPRFDPLQYWRGPVAHHQLDDIQRPSSLRARIACSQAKLN